MSRVNTSQSPCAGSLSFYLGTSSVWILYSGKTDFLLILYYRGRQSRRPLAVAVGARGSSCSHSDVLGRRACRTKPWVGITCEDPPPGVCFRTTLTFERHHDLENSALAGDSCRNMTVGAFQIQSTTVASTK